MKELKFRVFDKQSKTMFYPENGIFALNQHGDLLDISHARAVWGRIGYQAEVMKYTGLKDKNGKEICASDIVNIYKEGWDVFPSLECTGEVIYKKEFASFFVLEQGGELLSFMDAECSENIEIIGNIHENPELLEK